jgi:hypothetical protein
MKLRALDLEGDGWIRFDELGVRARFVERDGRFVPVGVELIDSVLTIRALQQIPFGRIEAAANEARVAEELRQQRNAAIGAKARQEGEDAASWYIGAIVSTPAVTIDLRRSDEARKKLKAILASEPTRYGDEFYRMFSSVYGMEAAQSPRPAAVLAEDLGVTVGRVWRWVRVCRSKGYLAPSRIGKEG